MAQLLLDKEKLDPTDPYVREKQTFPTLTEEQIARASVFGEMQYKKKGAVLFERGDQTVDFFIVLKGAVEIYEHRHDGTQVFTVHGEHQFTGELDLFHDRQILVGGRMADDGAVMCIKRSQFKRLMTAEPDIGEIITRAFILRRVGLVSHKQGSVTVLCEGESSDTLRIERFLRRNGYPLHLLSDPQDEERAMLLKQYDLRENDLPAVLIHLGEQVLKNPDNYELAHALGLVELPDEQTVYDVTIVGAGPAGLSAATYAASEGLSTLLIEQEAPGGQASTSSKIENYLGFPTGISGQALAGRAQVQAQKFGAKIVLPRMVKTLNCHTNPYEIELCGDTTIKTKSVVIATGARYRRLDVKDNRRFDNAGVHYAATAMESGLCKDQEVIVVGGGNSAGQAAVFLSNHARHVHLLIRRDNLKETMSDYLISRIHSSRHITLHAQTEITALHGDVHLEDVTWKHRVSGEEEKRPIRHVFLMIGAQPNTDWLADCVALDEKGFIFTGADAVDAWQGEGRNPMMLETSMSGIYAVGDVRSGSIKRVASGVGEGSMSINHVHQFLADYEIA